MIRTTATTAAPPDPALAQLRDEFHAARYEAERAQGAWEQAHTAGLPTAEEGGYLADRCDEAHRVAAELRRAVRLYAQRRRAMAVGR